MIGSVRGRVIARGSDHLIVEVQGIGLGYKVFVPRHPQGDAVLLHTHQVTREDGQFLYGFETRDELTLFEMLLGVSGVGPRAALALLATATPAALVAAIAAGDAAVLARAPGVGKKTAERLIVDLRSKVSGVVVPGPSIAPNDEAAAALSVLGYTVAEIAIALRAVPAAGVASTEERLAAALRTGGRASS